MFVQRLALSRALFSCPETVTQGTGHPLLTSNPQRYSGHQPIRRLL
nr:MAG TPA: hypothetical protein [Caudoviricetes sp.]